MKRAMGLVMVGAALVMSSCGGGVKPVVKDPVSVDQIKGQVTKAGANAVALKVGSNTLSTATVGADQHFTLNLPSGSQLTDNLQPINNLLSGLNCQVSTPLTASNPATQVLPVLSLRTSDNREVYGVISTQKAGFTDKKVLEMRGWVYANQDTTVTGKVDCAKLINNSMVSKLPVTVNVNLKQGWTVVGIRINADANLLPPSVNAQGVVENQSDGLTKFMDMGEITTAILP